MKFKNLLKYLISIIIIVLLIFYVINKEDFNWKYLDNIPGMIIFLLISMIWWYLLGLQLFILLKNQNKKLTFIDQLFLPISMALFGYIIPTNGGFLFSVYFLKKKYNLNLIDGISTNVIILYTSLILTGIFGILYCILFNNKIGIILPISVLMIIFPIIVNISAKLLVKINIRNIRILEKFTFYINKIVISANSLLKYKHIFSKMIAMNILIIIVNILITYWLIYMFHINVPILSIIMIVLFMRLSSIIRILPGNFGIDELFAGGIFHFFGLPASDGIIISVYSRFISLIFLIIPIGIIHIVMNKGVLKISDLKNIKKYFAVK